MNRRTTSAVLAVVVAVGLAVAAPAPAYVPNTIDFLGGGPVITTWPSAAFPIPMRVTTGLTTDVSDGSDRSALEAAMSTWSTIPDSHAAVYLAGEGTVEANVFDGINAIEFSNSTDLAGANFVSLTYLLTEVDGTILEADVLVNDREVGFTTTAGGNVGLDLETAMLRELGRVLGLTVTPYGGFADDGSIDPTSPVMFGRLRGIGESARALADDDIAAMAALYPTGGQRGAIRGTATRNGAPLFGAHVVAFAPAQGITVTAVSLPDGSFEIGGLPPGRYVIEVAPLTGAVTPANLGGIFLGDTLDTTFRRVFLEQVVQVSAGQVTGGVVAEVER